MQISHNHLQNQYGESINHPDTWDFIAHELLDHGSIVLGWKDDQSTRFTLLLSIPRPLFSRRSELFVTVSGYGTVSIPRDFRNTITPKTIETYFGFKKENQSSQELAQLLEQILLRLK